MSMGRFLFSAAASLIMVLLIIYSCGNDASQSSFNHRMTHAAATYQSDPQDGTVRFAVTGDPSPFSQIISTIERVEIANEETGAVCEVVTFPATMNAADLAGVLQVVGSNKCSPGLYTSVRVELNKNLELMSASGANAQLTSFCSFVSYKDEWNQAHPLDCSGPLCVLDLKTDVNVPDGQKATVGLFIQTAAFDVENVDDNSTCAVSLKIVPISSENVNALLLPGSLTGDVTEVTATSSSFSLNRGPLTISADYSGIAFDQQPGLEALLKYAETENLRTKIVSSTDQISSENVKVKAVYVKVDGVVSGHDAAVRSFTLLKGPRATTVDYGTAAVNGILVDGACARVRLYGSDGPRFLATRVDIEPIDDSAYG